MKVSFKNEASPDLYLRDAVQGQAVLLGDYWYLHVGMDEDNYGDCDGGYVRLFCLSAKTTVFSHHIKTAVRAIRDVEEIIIKGDAMPSELPF